VLDAEHGLLALMLPAWKLGGGARLGTGRQHMSLISLNDWVRGVIFLIETPEASGAFNLSMPGASTNAEFTDALGKAVHRPTFLAAPAFILKAALGDAAGDLLGSLRLSPAALLDVGFSFEQPDLMSAVRAAVAQ
jgi:NAD dependent epimerase/dehydratase family enzyme